MLRRWVGRLRAPFLTVLVLKVLAVLVFWFSPTKITLTIDPETTRVTGPMIDGKRIDYAHALNQKYRGDATPENNAVVLLVQAIGTQREGFPENLEFYEEMGISSPEHQEHCFGRWVNGTIGDERLRQKEQWDRVFQQPWTVTDHEVLLEWIFDQQIPLELFCQAAERPNWYCPVAGYRQEKPIISLIEVPFFAGQIYREMTAALILRSFVHLQSDNPRAGWKDLLAVLKFSRLMSKSPFLIASFIAMSIESNCLRAIPIFLDQAQLKPDLLDQFWNEFKAVAPREGLSQIMDVSERYVMLSMIVNVFSQGDTRLLEPSDAEQLTTNTKSAMILRSINWDAGLRETNAFYDQIVAAVSCSDRKERRDKVKELTVKLKADSKSSPDEVYYFADARGRSLCRFLVGKLCPSFQKVVEYYDRMDQMLSMIDITFALAKYRADKGTYPQNLSELTPNYLASLPENFLVENKPLNYERLSEGYLLKCEVPKPAKELVLETRPPSKKAETPKVQIIQVSP